MIWKAAYSPQGAVVRTITVKMATIMGKPVPDGASLFQKYCLLYI